jgi:hypothetical protein
MNPSLTSPRRPVSHAFAVPVVREVARPAAVVGDSAW